MHGYTTAYTYDLLNDLTGVNQSGQARSYAFDDLGRMTSETNPENGTSTYTYDSESGTCNNSYPGDLVKKHDAAGNNVCFYYDQLHRLTDVGDNGPEASGQCERLRYDAQTVNRVAMANSKGRLARAYTDNCVSTVLTDEGFSYDADGRLTDFYESTPHSGGFFHLSGGYWANGQLNTLSMPGITALPAFTWGGLDGEGRPTTVTATSGQSPVIKSVSYNNTDPGTSNEPVGSLLGLTLGSNDADAFQYDKNTGRMTQYKFTVGTQSQVSNLAWNANGSLGSLAITDPFNAPDTQTCAYGHDDLGRISSANCGSVWSQTFSYDAFGNLSKSGSSSFLPTYSAATNHFTVTGGTVTYDADGNLTNDTIHSYAWNQFSRPTTIDSTTLTYDALGRVAETASGTTYTQNLFGLDGQKLGQMRGQTIRKLYVPMIGGTVAIYGSSGLLYYRHADWLGSTRLASTPAQTVSYGGAHAPFGEPYAETGSDERTFTGTKQETVSGLYDFTFREFSSQQQGRWVSPDPMGLGAVNVADPQSWNRYAYLTNNPLNAVDPTGLCNPDKNDDCTPHWENFDARTGPGICIEGPSCVGTVNVNGISVPQNIGNNYLLTGQGGSWLGVYGQFVSGRASEIQNITYVDSTGAAIFGFEPYGVSELATETEISDTFHVVGESWGGGSDFNMIFPTSGGSGEEWWSNFGKAFVQGVVHGVRQPGQSFTQCALGNANTTTGGAHALLLAGVIGSSLSEQAFNYRPGGSVSLAFALYLRAQQIAPGLGTFVGRSLAYGAEAAPYVAAAEAGLLIGSAINCR